MASTTGTMLPTDHHSSIMDEKKQEEEEPIDDVQDNNYEDDNDDDDGSSTATNHTTSSSSSSPFAGSLDLPLLLLQMENEQGGIAAQHAHTNTKYKNSSSFLKRLSSSSFSGIANVAIRRAMTNIQTVLDTEIFINNNNNTTSTTQGSGISSVVVGGGTTPHALWRIQSQNADPDSDGDDDDIGDGDSICSDLRKLDSWEENVRAELERAEDAWRLEKWRRSRVVLLLGGHGFGDENNENIVNRNILHHHHHHHVTREDTETEFSTDYDDEEEELQHEQDFITRRSFTATSPRASIVARSKLEGLSAMSRCSSLASLGEFAMENDLDNAIVTSSSSSSRPASLPNNSKRGSTTTGGVVVQQQTAAARCSGVSVTMAYDVLSSQVLNDSRSILGHWLQQKMHWRNVLIASGDAGGDNVDYSLFSSLGVPPATTNTSRDFTADEMKIPTSSTSATSSNDVTTTHPNTQNCYSKYSWKIGVPVLGSTTVSSDGQLRMLLICGGGRNDCIALALQLDNDADDEKYE